MEKQKSLYEKTIVSIIKLLIVLATLIVSGSASILWFGEPDCPASLKKKYKILYIAEKETSNIT